MMKDNCLRVKTCPKCGNTYEGYGAISRIDSLTVICPDCGTREALESIGVVDKEEQEKIIREIHKFVNEK